jgi:16S rRNA (uracil1498-N3)-methyltransferase
MSLPRFFCDISLSTGARLLLPDSLAHHAVRVLRLRDGADIVLFNGQGGEYPATLAIEGKSAYAQLGEHNTREAELAGHITIVQGLPSGDKMDWVIEKAVELGACGVTPITAQRSVLQLSGARLEKRVTHWSRIAQSASEQCGRNRLMSVEAPTSLRDWLAQPNTGLRMLCHPEGSLTLEEALKAASEQAPLQSVALLVGPEGGWSESELALAAEHHVQSIRFGSRVLRTETAGLALTAAVTALMKW